jgi:hypothetical protein
LDNSTVDNPAVSVNTKEQLSTPLYEIPATQLTPVLLRRGDHESFYHLPTCHVCHKPVVDFEAANVVVVGSEPSAPQESLGRVDDAEMFRLPGAAVVVHLECDEPGWMPWVRASSVFCRDQRGPIEKLYGWTVGR